MSLSRLKQGLFGRLLHDAAPEWNAYTRHGFLTALAAGTLPQADFRAYLVQDYLYLIQFARAYALALYKSSGLAEMGRMANAIAAVLAEMPLHVGLCESWGLTEADMQAAPESTALLAYSRFLLDCGQRGDLLDLLTALSVCVVGYGDIGARLLADPATMLAGNPYRAWIETYGGPAYRRVAEDALETLHDVAATRFAEGRYPELLGIFRIACRLEAEFWQAGRR
jgi:thiaminase/transcriptional activator TenA